MEEYLPPFGKPVLTWAQHGTQYQALPKCARNVGRCHCHYRSHRQLPAPTPGSFLQHYAASVKKVPPRLIYRTPWRSAIKSRGSWAATTRMPCFGIQELLLSQDTCPAGMIPLAIPQLATCSEQHRVGIQQLLYWLLVDWTPSPPQQLTQEASSPQWLNALFTQDPML